MRMHSLSFPLKIKKKNYNHILSTRVVEGLAWELNSITASSAINYGNIQESRISVRMGKCAHAPDKTTLSEPRTTLKFDCGARFRGCNKTQSL